MPKSYCANMLAIRCPHICKLAIHSAITSSQTPTSRVIIYGSVMTSLQTKSPQSCFLSQSRPSWDCWEQWRFNKRPCSVNLTPDIIGWRWLLDDRKGWRGLCFEGGGLWPWRSMCALALTRIVPVLAGKRLGAIWYDIRDSPFIPSSDLRPTVFHPSLYL